MTEVRRTESHFESTSYRDRAEITLFFHRATPRVSCVCFWYDISNTLQRISSRCFLEDFVL